MTTVVSYRFYCEDCDEETVIRERDLDDTAWKIGSKIRNSGLCPSCNPAVNVDDVEWEPEPDELELEELDHIGAKAAQNLREAGYDSDLAIEEASDDELLDVPWVGEKALLSLKEATKQLEPQQRWE